LDEQSGPVAGAIGRLGATVVESLQTLDGKTGDPERWEPVPGSDEPDATGFVVWAYLDSWSVHRRSGGNESF
jgi:hypothetical protein